MSIFKFGPRPSARTVGLAAVGVAAAGLLALPFALRAQTRPATPPVPAYLSAFPNFAPNVGPSMPGDVDVALKTRLENRQQFPLVQREFDLYSWQMFFAVAWPTNDQGQPAAKLTDTAWGAPRWTTWHTSPQIYRADGARPAACGERGGGGRSRIAAVAPRPDLSKPLFKGLGAFPAEARSADPRTTRFLGIISAVGNLHVNTPMSDIQQAFTGPLIDQNGEFVYYEILMDPNEVDYLCANNLYNINGQVAFNSVPGAKVVFPSGVDGEEWSGVFELKIAWKVLGKNDDTSRFFVMDGYIKDEDKDNKEITRKVKLGMVGLHIGHKTRSSPQWIWSTFEQVDNLATDPVAHPNLSPNFANPGCPICAVNVLPVANNGVYPRIPVQAWRSVPIPPDKQALNAQVRGAMKKAGSVWQYYQLIDTQWPTSPQTAPANPSGPLPAAVANKAGGDPTPVYLTNITMETYFQGGNTDACNQTEGNPGCGNTTPPASTGFFTAAGPVPASSPQASTTIFASESCFGCHSSAGTYKTYNPANPNAATTTPQLSGDFSWLMQQKAQWKSN